MQQNMWNWLNHVFCFSYCPKFCSVEFLGFCKYFSAEFITLSRKENNLSWLAIQCLFLFLNVCCTFVSKSRHGTLTFLQSPIIILTVIGHIHFINDLELSKNCLYAKHMFIFAAMSMIFFNFFKLCPYCQYMNPNILFQTL